MSLRSFPCDFCQMSPTGRDIAIHRHDAKNNGPILAGSADPPHLFVTLHPPQMKLALANHIFSAGLNGLSTWLPKTSHSTSLLLDIPPKQLMIRRRLPPPLGESVTLEMESTHETTFTGDD